MLSLSRAVAVAFLLVAYPLIAAVAAVVRVRHGDAPDGWAAAFAEQLLEPDDWFFKWRLNCVLASYHALVTNEAGYAMEDKLTFLEAAEAAGVAASPWLKLPAKLIVKHRNEEGGLGIAVYSNACVGGDWIIQECLDNHADLAALLPGNAPLDPPPRQHHAPACARAPPPPPRTFRCSVLLARQAGGRGHGPLVGARRRSRERRDRQGHVVRALVPAGTGQGMEVPSHLDGPHGDAPPRQRRESHGRVDPKMAEVRQLVVDAHLEMMPNVLLAGWDVAITPGACTSSRPT